jgi:hypothetical protein
MAKATPAKKLYVFKEIEDAIYKERFDLVERLQKLEMLRAIPGMSDEYLRFVVSYIGYKRETYGEEPVKRGAKITDE